MDQNMIHGLVDNIAILLALGLIYDVVAYKSWVENKVAKGLSGVILGLIGMFVMLNPWEFEPGLFFDTRSIVLSVGGLFFGTVPAIIAVIMTASLRIFQGGMGMYAGMGVIITSGLMGVLLREYKLRNHNVRTLIDMRMSELLGLGISVHILMLLWMLVLPKPDAYTVIARMALPVMSIYPLGTLLIGRFIISRVKRVAADKTLKIDEERYRNFVENASDSFYLSDINGKILDVNEAACLTMGYSRTELLKLSIADLDANHIPEKTLESRKQIIAGNLKNIYTNHRCKDGKLFPVEVRVRSYGTKEQPLFLSLVRDITERMESEEALRESESKFRALTVHSPVGVFLNDKQGNVTYINDKCPELIGISADQAMDFDWVSAIHPEDREAVTKAWTLAIQEGDEFHMDYRWLHADGKVIWTHGNIVPVRGSDDEISMFIGTLTNITKRKQAEQELKVSENRFRNVAESMSDWIWEIDTSGVYTYSSANIESILGYRAGEVIGKTPFDFMLPEEVEKIGPLLKDILLNRSKFRDLENWNITKTGRKVCLLTSGVPIFDEAGEFQGFRGIDKDITYRKEAEAELEKTVSLLEAIFGAMPDALLAANLNREIISTNKAFTRILGYSELEMLGKQTSYFYESQAEYERQGKMRYSLSAKQQLAPYVVNYKKQDGTVFPGETLGVPIFNKSQEKIGFIGIIRDISDRLQMENTLRQSQKLESLGTMVGGISHELNNILQSIFLYAGLIQDDIPQDSELSENMSQLLADGERARDLVNQILTFSRKTKTNYQAQPIHEIIKSALNFERASLPPNIDLVQDIQGDGGMVLCDKTQIHQIVINLCNNAQHAMGEQGGELKVTLKQTIAPIGAAENVDIKVLELEISDTGQGITAEIIDRIFDPFFTTKELGQGTGLGLSVIHGIIEMMDGQIAVESVRGKGSTFKILLPVVEGEESVVVPVTPKTAPNAYQNILLVDDEEGIRKVTQTALSRKGFMVEVAGDGKHALELFTGADSKYDLIITDLSMPNMSGVELSQEIRETNKEIPIILSTGHIGLDDMVKFSNAGISGFIQKPWSVDELIENMRDLKSLKKKSYEAKE